MEYIEGELKYVHGCGHSFTNHISGTLLHASRRLEYLEGERGFERSSQHVLLPLLIRLTHHLRAYVTAGELENAPESLGRPVR